MKSLNYRKIHNQGPAYIQSYNSKEGSFCGSPLILSSMHWIKNTIVDLLTIPVIALSVFYDSNILTYVVYIYTGLMVIARLFSLSSSNFRAITRKKVENAPLWVYHLIYLLNVIILTAGQWFIVAACWMFIWIAAVFVYKKNG